MKKVPYWDLFPIGWDQSDLQQDEQIYRSPWDCFGEFLKAPLKNSNGEWICRDAEKKQALKNAYQALGMNRNITVKFVFHSKSTKIMNFKKLKECFV